MTTIRAGSRYNSEVMRNIVNVAKIASEEALENIIMTMRSTTDENVRLKACQLILERGYGRPRQEVLTIDADDVVKRTVFIEFLDAPKAISHDDSTE